MGGSSSKEEFGPADADYSITIQYCGGWGYRSRAVDVRNCLTKEFGDKMRVIFNPDETITGNLEVVIINNKTGASKNIHSKSNGDGFVSKSNSSKLVEKARNFMKV